MQGFELYSACCDIDRRYAAQLPDTMVGRASAETVTALEAIVADYRRLALEVHRAAMLDRDGMDRKIADAVASLARAQENLGDHRAAERAYEEARDLYRRLGDGDEAGRCDAAIAQLHFRVTGDVDRVFASLHSRHDEEPLDSAERDIELAELHLSRNDDFEAETHLRRAESTLAPFEKRGRQDPPP
jgi:tetratricopeptide (TPR) repeat protein